MGEIVGLERRPSEPAGTLAEIDAERPEFLHAVLCQVSLPRTPQRELRFERSSGQASVVLKAGEFFDGLKWQQQPLPSGTRPRLVLIHACTEAVRTRSRDIDIGDSVRDFLRKLGIDQGGKLMGYFRREMIALACCEVTLAWSGPDGVAQMRAPPIRSFQAWSTDNGGQVCLWPGYMQLDQEFFTTLLEHAVPLDPRAIGGLQNSSLALDCYTWLAHRLCRIRKSEGVRLSWDNLHGQFGQEYGSVKKFKQKFLLALRRVQGVYPEARLEQVRGGLRLLPSPPPVKRKQVVVKLPAPPALPRPEPTITDFSADEPSLRLRLDRLDGINELRAACPGWDGHWLLEKYLAFMADKPAPRDAVASLVAWGRKFTKAKRPA